jgi:hypothetical protein
VNSDASWRTAIASRRAAGVVEDLVLFRAAAGPYGDDITVRYGIAVALASAFPVRTYPVVEGRVNGLDRVTRRLPEEHCRWVGG